MRRSGAEAGKDYLGKRTHRSDRHATVRLDATEHGPRYYYRCILDNCDRAWRTTIGGIRVCPFCNRSGGVQDRTGIRRSEF